MTKRLMGKHCCDQPAAIGARMSARQTWTGAFLVVGALSLTGCGASSNGEFSAVLDDQKGRGGVALDPATGSKEKAVRLPKASEAFASAATPGSSGYKIGPQDVLEVSVFKAPELTRSVQVADAGTINMPLVGEVKAAGRTAQEVERDLSTKLDAKYLQKPQVTVYVKEYNSQRVTVEGAVKKPGVYPLSGGTTLMQSLALAGGLNPASDLSNVVVFRQVEGERYAAKFDVEQIRSGKAEDPSLMPGDMVVANASAMKAAWEGFLQFLPASSGFIRAY